MSISLGNWAIVRLPALDEIEDAHRSVGGTGRGRRYATQQINHAYAVLLSSHFQGFCRDLHSECVEHIVLSITPADFRITLRKLLTQDRKLDKGNPNPGNIGADFGLLGVGFWPAVRSLDWRNPSRQNLLEDLNSWRNAIAHQDFSKVSPTGAPNLALRQVRQWRSACEALADGFDRAMYDYVLHLTGKAPW
jgi:hypothetical protein